ncbi:MAG: HDOD domain-containing protein [Burkholderiales bacterium]|nr:HDOD domain-containing protein [Burkholderiales bacterium]
MELDLEALDREAEEVVKDIRLPPCPAVLTQLVREMRGDEPDFARLTRLIGGDVTLAATVLRTVNSAFYGLRTKVASIKHALALLGLKTVTNLVTGLLLRQAFPSGGGAHLEEFWERSAGCARAAAALAQAMKAFDADEAYTFALFRDCGIPAMVCGYPGYQPDIAPPEGGRSAATRETGRYGMNHAAMGARLAASWHLPESICKAVRRHHDCAAFAAGRAEAPEESVRLIALALTAEERYSRHMAAESCPEWSAHGAWALELLGIAETTLEELSAPVVAAIEGK